jgi:hypothetical protein
LACACAARSCGLAQPVSASATTHAINQASMRAMAPPSTVQANGCTRQIRPVRASCAHVDSIEAVGDDPLSSINRAWGTMTDSTFSQELR